MNAENIMTNLYGTLATIDYTYSRIAIENGLTFNTYLIMYMVEDEKPLTQKKVCDRLYLSKSTVHSMVLDLEKKGYITMTAGSNKKEKYIVFTPEGEKFMNKVNDETNRIEQETLRSFSEQEMETFLKTAEKLAQKMTAASELEYKDRKRI